MDTRTWNRWCIIACIAIACIANDATAEPITCYHCEWRSKVCHTPIKERGEYSRCITEIDAPLTKEKVRESCAKKQCGSADPLCFKTITEINGSPNEFVYGCGRDMGKSVVTVAGPDGYVSEAFFCEEDLCNGGMRSSAPSIFVLTLLTALALLRLTSAFM